MSSVELERTKLYFFVALAVILMCGYLILSLTGHREEAKPIGELLTIVVIAMVSYWLGYAKRESTVLKSNPKYAAQMLHISKSYIKRLGYIAVGFGIALILQHVVCSGIDLELTELLLGHEWIGLYCLIAGMIMIGMSKKLTTHTISKTTSKLG